jgi:hypothetical protein
MVSQSERQSEKARLNNCVAFKMVFHEKADQSKMEIA